MNSQTLDTAYFTQNQKYDDLRDRSSMHNIKALNACRNTFELPSIITDYRNLIVEMGSESVELLRRVTDILHILLIDRTYRNKTFRSPIFTGNLRNRSAFAANIEELKEVADTYLNAIEDSLNP